jgi:hypothetical protein
LEILDTITRPCEPAKGFLAKATSATAPNKQQVVVFCTKRLDLCQTTDLNDGRFKGTIFY